MSDKTVKVPDFVVLKYIRNHKDATITQIANDLMATENEIQESIKRLMSEGKVHKQINSPEVYNR